jgi:hypothetical protein
MHKCGFHLVLALLLIVALGLGFNLTGHANPWWGSTRDGLSAASAGLLLKVTKKHCERVFVCDYFAPATSCSTPPCCKKGHHEKHCEKKSKGSDSMSSDSALKSHPCYPLCQAQCANTRTNVTPEQCIQGCLAMTRC